MWMEVYLYSVKGESQVGHIWAKDIIITQIGKIHNILS